MLQEAAETQDQLIDRLADSCYNELQLISIAPMEELILICAKIIGEGCAREISHTDFNSVQMDL